MGILAFLQAQLFGRHTPEAGPAPEQTEPAWGLRAALLKCEELTEAEVDEYIAYEEHGIVYEEVPLDYGLNHPDADISYLYADGILETTILRRHTNQISPETLAKVQRVLPVIFLHCPKNGR